MATATQPQDNKDTTISQTGSEIKQDMTSSGHVTSMAPDGGYCWVVVFASFVCSAITEGVIITFGVFLPTLRDYFSVGTETIVLAASLQIAVFMGSGTRNCI